MSNRGTKTKKRSNPKRVRKPLSVGTATTIIGLLIGLIGLIALRTKMSVTPQEPTQRSQPFSVPFRFENTNVLPFTVEHVYCYVGAANSQTANSSMSVQSSVIDFSEWKNVELGSDGGGTVSCPVFSGAGSVTAGDITIVIDYKPFLLPGTGREYFRFIGAYIDNWQWERKSVDDIKKDVDAAIAAQVEKPHLHTTPK